MRIHGLAPEQTLSALTAVNAGKPANPQSEQGFGAAFVRETGPSSGEAESAVYGSDARMLNTLKERDRAVRDAAKAQGEAVGGRQFAYQTGPDGEQYAIGSLAHVVRREGNDPAADNPAATPGAGANSEDQALQDRLEDRDAKVRAHELAHIMAAGGQAQGLPQYTYQTGPDGKAYAIGGSVNISMTSSGDAEQTARQAETARRAALATGEPSIQDSLTANQAGEMASRARQRALDSYNYAEQGDSPSDLSLTA